METLRAWAVGTFVLLMFVRLAGAQANVNEALELYTFYVATNGSDSNPGTEDLPFKTIGYAASQALANNYAGKGTHVWINNGTYRESISISASKSETSWPITFEAINHGQVTISGGVLYTGWTTYSGNSSIYTNVWNNTWGTCANVTGCPTATYPQPEIMLRQEMVAVNGTPMTEVLSLTQMVAGTFYVDTSNKTIYLWPPSGTEMSTAAVDVATEPSLFNISGFSNLVVRGIVFQYANSCRSNAAVNVTGSKTYSPTNILFDTDTIKWNNGQGLALNQPISYFTVENTSSLHNGDSGFQGYNTQYGLWQNDVVAYNNWRGAQGTYYACNVAGFHSWEAHTDDLAGFTAQYNQAYGIHWDTDNVSITGSDVIASQNLEPGLDIETNPGPFTFTGSYVCNQSGSLSEGGLAIRNSEAISFTDGVFYNNNGAQISISGTAGGITITDWLTGKVYDLVTQGMVNTNNVVEGIGMGQLLFADPLLNGTDWTTFLDGFVSNENTWWNATTTTGDWVVPTPALSTAENLAGWQLTTLQDLSSTFAAPSGTPQNKCAVTADANDYWLTVDNPSVTADAAGMAVFNLTVSPLLNFAGTVNFTLDGISEVPGLSAANPTSITTSGTTPLTINSKTTTAVGTYPVTIIGNSGSQTHTATVYVVIPETSVRLSTDSLTFAAQQDGTTSAGQSFTIQNTGKTSLTITSVTTTMDYAISKNTCGVTLKAGKDCTVTVTFTPESVGTVNGTVTIVDGDPTSPQTVALSGTGTGWPIVTLSPKSLTFGSVLVKTSSEAQVITLTNSGLGTLNFTGGNKGGITITGIDAADFTQTNTCGTSVAVGASCTVTVTFTPQQSGTETADVTFSDNTATGTQTVALSGIGSYPRVSLTPQTINFGSVLVGSKSAAMTSTLTNSGVVSLIISKLDLSGANPSEYAETNNCVGTFAPGDTCTITATFTPSTTGTQSASITITDNTSAGSSTLNLTGSGATPRASLNPVTLAFESVEVGSSSAKMSSTLTNSGKVTLTITKVALSGAHPSEYSQTNNCIGSFAPNATCTITATFSPTAVGAQDASVTITDNTSAGSNTLNLTGTGALPTASLKPSSDSFGSIAVGKSSAAKVSTLTNTSNYGLSITSITITGADPADYSQTNTCPVGGTLAANASCTISVTFTPTVSGTLTATVTESDNSSAGTHSITLTGNGTN
jgi:hypothetical protein